MFRQGWVIGVAKDGGTGSTDVSHSSVFVPSHGEVSNSPIGKEGEHVRDAKEDWERNVTLRSATFGGYSMNASCWVYCCHGSTLLGHGARH